MSSEAKRAANRENARKSTGPRTERGKTKSKFNALKYGIYATTPILPGEDADAYREIVKSNLKHFAPVGPVENMLVHQITTEQWRLERIQRAENALHARLKEGKIGQFLGSLDDRGRAYVRSAYADELSDQINQERRQQEAYAPYLASMRAAFAGSRPAMEIPPKSDKEASDDVEARLRQILQLDNALLEVLVPNRESAPQTYLVQERRTAMRTYLAYVGKLQDLQEARLTLTLSSRPQLTATAQKRADAKRPQQMSAEEAANQNNLKPDNDVPEK